MDLLLRMLLGGFDVIVGITGASGSVLAKVLLKNLSALVDICHIVATDNGAQVFEYETGLELGAFLADMPNIVRHSCHDMFAPIASGSFDAPGMAIVPCSMATVGKLANGIGDNLLLRAADVMLKERKTLVIVPRETPMHATHLCNLAKLATLGAVILPPVPAFYDRVETWDNMVNGVVGRILKQLGFTNDLYKKWSGVYV